MFLKRHYEVIAKIIKSERETGEPALNKIYIGPLNAISAKLADYFAKENPRFDRERFRKACGLVYS